MTALLWVPPFEMPALDAGCEHAKAGGNVPARYSHINFKPTKGAATASGRGIALRKKHGRGGLREGREMAGRISRREKLHPDLVMKMVRFFSRFAGQAKKQRGTEKWNTSSDEVSNLRIAWDLWGGDAGWAWARAQRRQMEAADKEHEGKSLDGLLWVQRSAEDRTVFWRSWLDSVQRPTERKIRAQWKRGRRGLLPDQAKRYSERAGQVLGEGKSVIRQVTQADLDAILMDDVERMLLLRDFDEDVIDDALRLAFERTARRFRFDIEWDPTTDPTDQLVGDMIANVQDTTRDRVARIIRAGVDAGVSTAELQRAIVGDNLFGPSRALRIARTETAKVVSEGTLSAYSDAAGIGVEFKVEWITARDSSVRPSHEIDGQKVDVGEDFTLEDGETGPGPGLFSSAANVVNCRCATRPVEIRRPT